MNYLLHLARFVLLSTATVLGLGLILGGPSLHIVNHFISEFAARADLSGQLVRLSMWGFAVTYILVAAYLLSLPRNSLTVILGCLALAAAASLLPFVAEYRLYVWEDRPPPPPNFWQKIGLSKPPRQEKPESAAERERVHGNAILASMFWVTSALLFIGLGSYRSATAPVAFRHSWAIAAVAMVLFWACQLPAFTHLKGLLELAAFAGIAGWLFLATRLRTKEEQAKTVPVSG